MSGCEGISAGIVGLGSYLPDKVLTNYDLEKMVDTTNEWIVKRTGIYERRILEQGLPAISMGIEAARRAISDAGIAAEDIDLVIGTTECPDYLTPSAASVVQREIGAWNAATFDLNAACAGFVYALTIADNMIRNGYYKYVLIVCCEALSRILDWNDRNTCVLLGDGAGAVVVGSVEPGSGVLSTYLGSDGTLGHNITIPCCYASEDDISKRSKDMLRTMWMDGSEVFKFAVKILPLSTEKVLEKAGIPIAEVKLIIPHQANIRIIEGAAKRLGIDMSVMYTNLHKYGNISSASIPVALDEASRDGIIIKGDNLVFVGFGGGLTWASALVKWSKEL